MQLLIKRYEIFGPWNVRGSRLAPNFSIYQRTRCSKPFITQGTWYVMVFSKFTSISMKLPTVKFSKGWGNMYLSKLKDGAKSQLCWRKNFLTSKKGLPSFSCNIVWRYLIHFPPSWVLQNCCFWVEFLDKMPSIHDVCLLFSLF